MFSHKAFSCNINWTLIGTLIKTLIFVSFVLFVFRKKNSRLCVLAFKKVFFWNKFSGHREELALAWWALANNFLESPQAPEVRILLHSLWQGLMANNKVKRRLPFDLIILYSRKHPRPVTGYGCILTLII